MLWYNVLGVFFILASLRSRLVLYLSPPVAMARGLPRGSGGRARGGSSRRAGGVASLEFRGVGGGGADGGGRAGLLAVLVDLPAGVLVGLAAVVLVAIALVMLAVLLLGLPTVLRVLGLLKDMPRVLGPQVCGLLL